MLLTDSLSVTINRAINEDACPLASPNADSDPGIATEGFVNTTALVMNGVFYPLGKQPRQFDTFYLGCTDAFSKHNASVSICFEMADPAPASFAAVVTGVDADRILVSAGADGALHVFSIDADTGALSPFRGTGPLQPSGDAGAISLDGKPGYRLPVWTSDNNPQAGLPRPAAFPSEGSTIAVAVSAGNAVWVWRQAHYWTLDKPWVAYNAIPRDAATANPNAKIDALAYLPGPASTDAELYAAFDGKLFYHSALENRAGEPWSEVQLTGDFTAGDKVRIISPVYELNGALPEPSRASGLVAILEHDPHDLGVYVIDLLNGAQRSGVCVKIESPATVVPQTQPAAGRIGDDYTVFWHRNDPLPPPQSVEAQVRVGHIKRNPASNSGKPWSAVTFSTVRPSADPKAAIVGGSFDILKVDGKATLIVVTRNGDQSSLSTLTPFDAESPGGFEAPLPAGRGPLAGTATVFGSLVVAPGARSDAWLGVWDPGARQKITVTLKTGILVASSPQPLKVNDQIAIVTASDAADVGVIDTATPDASDAALYALHPDIAKDAASVQQLLAFRVQSADTTQDDPANQNYVSQAVTAGGMTLDAKDQNAWEGEWLLVKYGLNYLLRQIDHVDHSVGNAWEVTFTQSKSGTATINPPSYWHAEALSGRVAPFFDIGPGLDGKWTASRLEQATFLFDESDPLRQHGKVFTTDTNGRPKIVVLDQQWKNAPVSGNAYIDLSTGDWKHQLGDTTSNPELAWEYWTGANWTQLKLRADATLNLKQTGKFEFTVPVNLAPTDVGGKNNYWIRARLVGGDYGQEEVKVITTPVGKDGATEQIVKHLPADIRPPLVIRLRVSYALSRKVLPAYLLTRDSGSLRDQSDANRTEGATVEAFVPLSLLMKRLEAVNAAQTPSPSPARENSASAPCGCSAQASAKSAGSPPAQASETKTASANGTRAILLGFDGVLLGEPVNVLLLNEERPHDAFAPLTVEALSRDRFEGLTAKDTTRALGESGLLSMSFPVQPGARELFGGSRAWLRLRPSTASDNAAWQPAIRGAYLNAAWARAAETLTREALGSSDGRPALTLNLARPPLLHDSLELRVREPLDEEEREAMLDADPATDDEARIVKFDLPDLPGDWVLWRQVPDPADHGPHDRVYALDESSGEVLFGDGIHGMIPPIGRDSVCAFRYQRTEPAADGSDAVPANDVEARTALNLVTPVEGVEAAFAAEHAAGGSPPESTARVLRFGGSRLRHRGRAVVPRDFEDLVRASLPNVAQAHAFRRTGGLRLVVVMAGATPQPTAVQRRAFHRLLLEAAAPSFGEKASLTLDGPRVRRLRVHLALRVTSLDDAGETALDVKAALRRFFDTATGGVDGEGWPLGAAPADDDIAFALSEARGLESIASLSFAEVGEDGTELPWRAVTREDELVLLHPDPVRIVFQALEAQT